MKPCPFCGVGTVLIVDTSRIPNEGDTVVWLSTVVCRKCNAVGPSYRWDHPIGAADGAVTLWNRRPE